MAVTLFTDRRMLDHRVPARHPERPERLQAVLRQLERTGYLATVLAAQCGRRPIWNLGEFTPPGTVNGLITWKRPAGGCSTRIPGSFQDRTWRRGWRPALASRRSRLS